MRNHLSYLFYEIRALFLTPASYIATILFLLLMGFIYLVILDGFSQSPQEGLPSTEFFKIFWLPVFFVVPLLTMKSIAEERRLGTLESLMATPVSSFSVVFSKFFSAYIFYLLIWALTLGFPFVVQFLLPDTALDPRLIDVASLTGGFLFVALSGLFYIALGIFASSLTKSQLVAGMLTFCLLFVAIVGARTISTIPFLELSWLQLIDIPIDYLQTFQHLDDFSKGIIDSRPFFYYTSFSCFFLITTSLIVEAKA